MSWHCDKIPPHLSTLSAHVTTHVRNPPRTRLFYTVTLFEGGDRPSKSRYVSRRPATSRGPCLQTFPASLVLSVVTWPPTSKNHTEHGFFLHSDPLCRRWPAHQANINWSSHCHVTRGMSENLTLHIRSPKMQSRDDPNRNTRSPSFKVAVRRPILSWPAGPTAALIWLRIHLPMFLEIALITSTYVCSSLTHVLRHCLHKCLLGLSLDNRCRNEYVALFMVETIIGDYLTNYLVLVCFAFGLM